MAGAGFFAGTKYQQSQTGRMGNGQLTGQMRQGAQGGQMPGNGQFPGAQNRQGANMGLRPVSGTILSTADGSITVELSDGSSKIILLTDKSVINKTEAGSVTDLVTGGSVVVFGTENTDGSVTAENVQLNPNQQGMMRGQ